MSPVSFIPLLLAILIGLLFSVVTWGTVRLVRLRRRTADDVPITQDDNVLVGLLIVAAFLLGMFFVFAFLGVALW